MWSTNDRRQSMRMRSLRNPRAGIGFGVAAAVCASLSTYALSFPLNHDVGWFLYMAGAMLDGEPLYTSLIEVNPPLYVYLAIIPVQVARWFGLSTVALAQALVLLLSLAAMAWAGYIAAAGTSKEVQASLTVGILSLAVLGLGGIDFGQREHLMVALTAPYLVLAARRDGGYTPTRTAAVVTGLTAAVGFAIKPHFVVLWLAIELYRSLRSGSWTRSWLRVESLTVLAFILGYAGLVLLVHPEYLPLLSKTASLYSEYWPAGGSAVQMGSAYAILLVITIGAFLALRPAGDLRLLIKMFLVPAVLAFTMAVWQGKGWSYHFYPAMAWTMVAVLLMSVDYLAVLYRDMSRVSTMGVVTIVLLVVAGVMSAGAHVENHIRVAKLRAVSTAEEARFLERNRARSVLIMSPLVARAFPLVNHAGVEWTSPFPSLWWVAAARGDDAFVFDSSGAGSTSPDSVEGAFRAALVSGVVRTRPDLVLIETLPSSPFGGRPFPYIAYLSEEPTFEAFWGAYQRSGAIGPFAVYSRGELEPAR